MARAVTIISPRKTKPGYWRKRLFKSTFTHKGKRFTAINWAVKIQHLGKRKTFSLSFSDRAKAAWEACRLYRTLVSQGWDAVANRRDGGNSVSTSTPRNKAPEPEAARDANYWRLRLLRRKHPTQTQPGWNDEFFVRIGHEGISHYFPLGGLDEETAAVKALEIYRTVVGKGWNEANQRFSHELTLGFHWVADPVAWTYTTIHTRVDKPDPLPTHPRNTSSLNISIVESDAGLRQAIAWYLQCHQPFLHTLTFANGADALQEIPRRSIHLALSNHSLPDMSGDQFLETLTVLVPRLPGLIYSVYEDSDQLFRATPGGASGYLLKRTSPEHMLAPIGGLLSKGPLLPQQILQQVRQYFRDVTTLLQSSDEVHEIGKLTPREKEILGYLSKGYLDKEIAHTLGISVWTVHGHLKNVFEKLQVHSRTEAVVKYLQK